MAQRFIVKKLFNLMFATGIMGLSSHAIASAFQIWEQDAASVANYHAGRAALANDASIAYYNPAGITRFKNQQVVLGNVAILTDIKYRGTVLVNTIFNNNQPFYTVSQGGSLNQVPNCHYVAPLTENIGFGLSLAAPFGLETNWGSDNPLRYAATRTELQVADLSPALGFNLTQKLSFGIGLDIERMSAQFRQVDALGEDLNATSTNKGWDIGWGYHAGLLYQFTPETRAGLVYNSHVVHHFRGTSKFQGEIADIYIANDQATPDLFYSRTTNANLTLPPFTTLSAYHKLNNQWAIMGTAIYTQWTSIQNITLNKVAGINADFDADNNISVVLPAHYRNTWNFSIGTDYYATDKLTLRGGVGYDKSPVPDRYRAVEIPDDDHYAIALGGHYQATKTLGFDLGWTHLFLLGTATIAPPTQISGAQQVTTRGTVQGSADVFGVQFTWDMI